MHAAALHAGPPSQPRSLRLESCLGIMLHATMHVCRCSAAGRRQARGPADRRTRGRLRIQNIRGRDGSRARKSAVPGGPSPLLIAQTFKLQTLHKTLLASRRSAAPLVQLHWSDPARCGPAPCSSPPRLNVALGRTWTVPLARHPRSHLPRGERMGGGRRGRSWAGRADPGDAHQDATARARAGEANRPRRRKADRNPFGDPERAARRIRVPACVIGGVIPRGDCRSGPGRTVAPRRLAQEAAMQALARSGRLWAHCVY